MYESLSRNRAEDAEEMGRRGNENTMKITIAMALLALAPTAAMAQKWEVGLTGGYSFLDHVNATGGPSTATAGFAPGFAAGAFLGENLYRHVSGEIRYEYMQSNLRLTSGGQTADF